MFVAYFEPIYFRNKPDVYIHYFYKFIQSFGYKNVYFLTNEQFFCDTEILEKENYRHLTEFVQNYHEFLLPNNKILEKCKKCFIPINILQLLLNNIGKNYLDGERILLTEYYQPLVDFFDATIKNLLLKNDLEGIITVKNCPSLEEVAQKYNLPVIHFECGGLRPYDYQFLNYFDFKGVNGNTSADSEFERFIEEFAENPVNLMSNREILELLSRNGFEYKNYVHDFPKYKIGAALQLFDDSNLIAFSNGYNSESLISFLKEKFYINDIIIRNHPSTIEEKLLTFNNIDNSVKAVEFIHKCEKIITINSSVAFEAALYNKPVYILGDSPYKMLAEDLSTLTIENHKIKNDLLRTMKINFLTFVYMVPYELFFNIEYLRYRLTNPSTVEIFNYHVNYYKNKKRELDIKQLISLKKEIENLKSSVEKKPNVIKKNNFFNKLYSFFRKHLLLFKIMERY